MVKSVVAKELEQRPCRKMKSYIHTLVLVGAAVALENDCSSYSYVRF
jgi:hypothetical protein